MTDETLKLYTDLQPFFRERMGDWQLGDYLFEMIYKRHGRGIVASVNDKFIRVRFREVDRVFDLSDKGLIHLPLPIDPIHPERGLWRMIDWRCAFPHIGHNGVIYICDIKGHSLSNGWQTPELALLETIWIQQH